MIMKTWEKVFYLGTGLLLAVFFLFSYRYSFEGGDEGRVYNIAVIINESSDIHYKNMRKGMDQGVAEFHIDMNFITLYDDGDFAHQEELIDRELENNIDGIVVIPADDTNFYRFVEEYTERTPMILLFDGEEAESIHITATIAADNEEMGRLIGTRMIADMNHDERIYIVTGAGDRKAIDKRYHGLIKTLEDSGYQSFSIMGASGDYLEACLLEILEAEDRPTIVALDEKNLLFIGSWLEQNQVKANLYGIGSSNQIIHYLESGIIESIVAPDYFGIGYLAMEQCVKAIKNEAVRKNIIVKSILVDKDTLYQKENERMLFPTS